MRSLDEDEIKVVVASVASEEFLLIRDKQEEDRSRTDDDECCENNDFLCTASMRSVKTFKFDTLWYGRLSVVKFENKGITSSNNVATSSSRNESKIDKLSSFSVERDAGDHGDESSLVHAAVVAVPPVARDFKPFSSNLHIVLS